MSPRGAPADLAVIMHKRTRRFDPRRYAITHLAARWRAEGISVVFVQGTRRFVPARCALLHVDLSQVPERYIRFAQRYPRVLNGRLTDVRKSVISHQLVGRDDDYDGPVIVKTDANCGGHPERKAMGHWRRGMSVLLRRPPSPIRRKHQYRVFEHRTAVPEAWWDHPDLVVERFVPERRGTAYVLRCAYVLGGLRRCEAMVGPHPIVSDATSTHYERHEPHPGMIEAITRHGVDYGKIDFVVHEGRCVLLDINPTVGSAIRETGPFIERSRALWAAGLRPLLDR